MPNGNVSIVLIKLDGLLLYRFDETNKICEARVLTNAGGHHMTIKVESTGAVPFLGKLSTDDLKRLNPLSIALVDSSNPDHITNSATKNGSFDLISDLEGIDFYNRKLEIKDGEYECSIFIHNGIVGGGDIATSCFRVEKPIFEKLKRVWRDEIEFEDFKKTDIQIGKTILKNNDFIKSLGSQTAATVQVKLELKQGQELRLFNSEDDSDVFPPLKHGKDHIVNIRYVDIVPPKDLMDDLGFAHHSAAMKLKPTEAIFGLFDPIFGDPDSATIAGATPPGCCISCRISVPANGLGSSIQPVAAITTEATSPAKKKSKKSGAKAAKKGGAKKTAAKKSKKAVSKKGSIK